MTFSTTVYLHTCDACHILYIHSHYLYRCVSFIILGCIIILSTLSAIVLFILHMLDIKSYLLFFVCHHLQGIYISLCIFYFILYWPHYFNLIFVLTILQTTFNISLLHHHNFCAVIVPHNLIKIFHFLSIISSWFSLGKCLLKLFPTLEMIFSPQIYFICLITSALSTLL